MVRLQRPSVLDSLLEPGAAAKRCARERRREGRRRRWRSGRRGGQGAVSCGTPTAAASSIPW